MFAPFLTPGSGGAKPKPEPNPEPQKPIVPLVVYTAFDAQTAEELKKRLEETIHPVDLPSTAPKKTTYDPPPYEHEPAKRSKAPSDKLETLDAGEPPLADLPRDGDWEDEPSALDPEFAWSSETPFISLDATEMSDYYSALDNELVREVATCLRHEKLIHFFLDDPLKCLKLFPTYTWDEESDAAAEKFIQWYVQRFRAELEQQRDRAWMGDDIGALAKDAANNEREILIAYDLKAGEVLFVRYGDEDSVTVHTLQQRLAEGREIYLIHNHPNNSGASPADLNAADFLDAEYMLIVNPDGTVRRHQKVDGALVELEPWHFPEFVAPVDPVETVLHAIAYGIQTASEAGNPAEAVFEQGDTAEDEITIKTDSRLVSEFLLNPAAIVFLDDVAKEYGVEDESFYSAMVATIIYRELQDPPGFGLPNAAHPAYQSNWDFLKSFLSAIPRVLQRPIEIAGRSFDQDPSLGIGALSRLALFRIERDAREQGIDIYAPLLGFDIPTTLSEVPFSKGIHERTAMSAQTLHYANLEFNRRLHPTTVFPPSNEKVGAWRIKLADFTETSEDDLYSGKVGGSIQQLYEPTLGIIAAEVKIAMQSPKYQELQTEEERIAFLIAFHASRSEEPEKRLYNPDEFSEDTHNEIQWARDFMELMNARRTEIQGGTQDE